MNTRTPSPPAQRQTRVVRPAAAPAPAGTPAGTPAGASPSRPSPSRPRREPAGASPSPVRPGGMAAPVTPGGAAAPQRPARPAPAPAPSGGLTASPGGPVPGKPEGKPGDLMTVLSEFADLLATENAALKAHQYQPVHDALERKQALTRLYVEQAVGIRRNPAHVAALPDDQRARLKEAAARIDELAVENQRLLKANVEAIERFLGAVAGAAREKQAKEALVYGGKGTLDDRTADHRPMAVAVNREL